MRAIFTVVFVASVIVIQLSMAILLDRVAIHLGAGGYLDSWASKETHAAIFLAIEVTLFLMMWFTVAWVAQISPSRVNLPNKEYWLRSEHR